MTSPLVELSLNSQLFDLLAVRACQYVVYHREPRRPAATGQRRTSRLLLLGHGDGETRQWRSGVRQPRLPGRATECRSPGDQKQLAADLSHSSASAKERSRASDRDLAGRRRGARNRSNCVAPSSLQQTLEFPEGCMTVPAATKLSVVAAADPAASAALQALTTSSLTWSGIVTDGTDAGGAGAEIALLTMLTLTSCPTSGDVTR